MNYKILVVEDDNQIQELIVEFLSSQDYIVDTANDGVEGLRIIEKKKDEFDLIILDLIMPVKDGISILEHMKEKNINT